MDKLPIESIDSKKYDIFSLGIVILEIELTNYKKLCKDDVNIREKFENAYEELVNLNENGVYNTPETIRLSSSAHINIPTISVRKEQANKALELVSQYISENLKSLFAYIVNHILVDKSNRPELADFETKVSEYLEHQQDQCAYQAQMIV